MLNIFFVSNSAFLSRSSWSFLHSVIASFSEFLNVFLNGTRWANWRSFLELHRAHWKLSLFRTFSFSFTPGGR